MLLDEKSIHSLVVSDIERLISEEICESQRLEYKLEWWGANDEARREMLRDIAAMANSYRGYIVIGIATERGLGAGDLECPTQLAGIPPLDYAERISRSCRDNLDPICSGIDVSQLELGDRSIIVVVRVPQSLTAPHMVTFKGTNQFWQRHGTDKQPMSTNEVRGLILSRMRFEERLNALSANQLTEVGNRTGDFPILRLWASPITPLLEEVDVQDPQIREILRSREDPYDLGCTYYSGDPYPTLMGIQGEQSFPHGYQSIELHRGGYLEFCSSYLERQDPQVPNIVAIRVAAFSESFASLVTTVYSHLQAQGPLAFGCTLLRVQNYYLRKGSRSLEPYSTAPWTGGPLELGYRISYDFQNERASITRWLNDKLWNAFRLDHCPFYETGTFEVPDRT